MNLERLFVLYVKKSISAFVNLKKIILTIKEIGIMLRN